MIEEDAWQPSLASAIECARARSMVNQVSLLTSPIEPGETLRGKHPLLGGKALCPVSFFLPSWGGGGWQDFFGKDKWHLAMCHCRVKEQ